MAYKITLVRGDGTGPELTEVTAKVIEATGVKIDWEVTEAGVDIMEKEGTPLPDNNTYRNRFPFCKCCYKKRT